MRKFYTIIFFSFVFFGFIRCGTKPKTTPFFTKADSLADYYLRLQDTLHVHWNLLISDDNHKIKAMHHLLHELLVTGPADSGLYTSLEERLSQLERLRYTQKSLYNKDVVREYDFATSALIMELIQTAEAKNEYAYNVTLQKLVDEILSSDQRIMSHRYQYDSLAQIYNGFLERNRQLLIEANLSPEKKPLFEAVSSD